MPQLFDLLVLFGFDLIDRNVFFSVQTVELDRDSLYLALLVEELAFQRVQVGLEQYLALTAVLCELFFESFDFHFQRFDLLLLLGGVILGLRGALLLPEQVSFHLLIVLGLLFHLFGECAVPLLQQLELHLQVLEISQAFLVDFALLQRFGQGVYLLIRFGETPFGLFELSAKSQQLAMQCLSFFPRFGEFVRQHFYFLLLRAAHSLQSFPLRPLLHQFLLERCQFGTVFPPFHAFVHIFEGSYLSTSFPGLVNTIFRGVAAAASEGGGFRRESLGRRVTIDFDEPAGRGAALAMFSLILVGTDVDLPQPLGSICRHHIFLGCLEMQIGVEIGHIEQGVRICLSIFCKLFDAAQLAPTSIPYNYLTTRSHLPAQLL